MRTELKILTAISVTCWLLCWCQIAFAQDQPVTDTTPKRGNGLMKKIGEYRDSLRNKEYRQSFIRRITKQDVQTPDVDMDSVITKSEAYFTPFVGKVIRNIYYRQVKVFGPRSINDTTFTTSMKLIHLANRLHFDSREWVVRQSLFFREGTRLDPYELADNERYLRNRPFFSDARIHVRNGNPDSDSVDVEVVTKDVFEYGVDLSQFSATNIKTRVSNNNLLGAGQALQAGFQWRSDYSPTWNTEARYTKYNVLGSFVDLGVGYSTLNITTPLDTNVYEGTIYLSLNRPLYRNAAKWVGGLMLAENWSINILGREQQTIDSLLYRDYRYTVIDGWAGYNFINNYGHNGSSNQKPNFAVLFRHFNLNFSRMPEQDTFKRDPVYNDHRYYLLEFQVYRLDYFKAHQFFGFGRTEDIPLGYNLKAATGWETWRDRRRLYTGLEAQKYWTTRRQGLFNTTVGVSTFWQGGALEDAVIHARAEYYSRLFSIRKSRFRQFVNLDYLESPNPFFYKPLNINNDNGIWGYRNTKLNGYQRLNFGSETVYYSPLRFLGFKFNFFASLQASMITARNDNLFSNPVYLGIGGGFRIKNENLSLNTIKVSGYYFPNAPVLQPKSMVEITTIVDFRFDVSALKAPAFLSFR
ncbi:hypothetical protein HGH92_28595 [Chitinophaga varians]|uniref:Uncharacterized protein n=1 Tax=Chitinophaga varians TaxID=2202339 RepID=A0A847RRL7_9BACT|nr:hypothetical protein [Chitinophaga varians]NLR68300.1 hypothetical protein [Chitinophaga varians]